MGFFRKKKPKQGKQGGVAFFSSLFFLLVLGGVNSVLIPLMWDMEGTLRFCRFGAGVLLGMWLAHKLIRGHLSVLIHEYKHAILASLAGNRWKGMKVRRDSGHFEYAYSKETAGYNAFISLAPYFLPVFLIPTFLVGLSIIEKSEDIALLLVGIGYGIDLLLNVRDISPRQTDLTEIVGGYTVGCLYVFAINLTIFTILLAWVLQGAAGLSQLFDGLWLVVEYLVKTLRK